MSNPAFVQEQFDAPISNVGEARAPVVERSSERHATSAEEEEPSAEAFARMSRSERKRYREKKRRSEVNKGFDDLLALLLKVE